MKQTRSETTPATLPETALRRVDGFDLFVIIFLLLLFFLAARMPFGPNRLGDLDFYREAKAMAGALQGSSDWGEVAITKAPGPTLFFTVPFLFVPAGSPDAVYWRAGVVWSGLWTTLAILLIRRSAAALAGPVAGRTAAALALVVPFSIYYALGILAEPPAFVGTALLLFGWVRWWKGAAFRTLWLPGLILTVAGFVLLILSRPNAILLLPLGLAVALLLRRSRDDLRRRAAAATGVVLLAGAVMSTVVLTGTRLLPGRSGTQRQGGYLAYVLTQGRFQYRHEPWNWRYWDQDRRGTPDYDAWQAQLGELSKEAERSGVPYKRLQWQWLARDWLEHPFLTLRMAAVRLVTQQLVVVHSASPAKFRAGPFSGFSVYVAVHLGINVLSLFVLGAALLAAVRQRRILDLGWVLPGVWLALLLFNLISYAEPRYLFPAQPAVLVLAAIALAPAVTRLAALVPLPWRKTA